MEFLAPGVPGFDILEPSSDPPDFVDDSQGAVFLFLPERAGELGPVAETFPGGEIREFLGSAGVLRFVSYAWSPN